MKKYLLTSVIALLAIPSVFARQGADDFLEGGHRSLGHSGGTWTGSSWTGMVKPPMASGAEMPKELKGLHLAIGQLNKEDRAQLIKMIQDYLSSKGVDLSKYSEMRDDIRSTRKSTQEEMKLMRKQAVEAMKAKREAMKEQIKALKNQ